MSVEFKVSGGHLDAFYPMVLSFSSDQTGRTWWLWFRELPTPEITLEGDMPERHEIEKLVSQVNLDTYLVDLIEIISRSAKKKEA